VTETLKPWSTGASYLNFSEQSTDTSTAYAGDAYARPRAVREQVDPAGVLHANHPI